ncbi:hypothetical protein [Rhizobium sp. L1K21]|uniref:hypothetical protein n=1 Tax=Rhizobium sp. L1K21 TaxID=2954933 RepID=UPI002091E772|nr:hypothetical protein [Rhizobium sp. L1K21]MCO6188244.1 hypothetical protein [Rhizobium sp. L1K21]
MDFKSVVDFARALDRDERGITVAEMIMLAAVVLIPTIIAMTGFGKDVVKWLGDQFGNVKGEEGTIKWESS